MKLVLIDYSNIGHMAWAVNWKSPDPSATSTTIVAKVRELASGQPHVALCIDTGKSFRHDISADYKAHREARPQALYYNMDAALDVLRGDGFPVWGAAGYEADDVIASAVYRMVCVPVSGETCGWCGLTHEGGPEMCDASALIVSADKDLAQLINERVTVFSPMTGKTRGLAEMHADFGIQPHQVVDFLALVGDASDNIKGAEGIGPKKAAALLNIYGNLDDCYAAMDNDPEFNKEGALSKALVAFRPRLAEVRSLLTLKTDAPIPFEQIFAERRPLDVATFGDDIDFAMQPLVAAKLPPAIGEQQMEDHGKQDSDLFPSGAPGFPQEIIDLAAFGQKLRDIDKDIENDRVAQAERFSGEQSRVQAAGSTPAPVTTLVTPEATTKRKPASVGSLTVDPEYKVQVEVGKSENLERLPPVEWEKQLEPRTINEAKQLSDWIFASRLFSAYGHPAGVLTTILAGRELGMQAMASLRGFFIVEGKPTLSADLIRALVIKSGKAKFFRPLARTAEIATWETQRGDDPPVSLSYTIQEAQAAGLVKKGSGWEKSPCDMLTARASAKLARLIYADVVFNLYDPSEMEQ